MMLAPAPQQPEPDPPASAPLPVAPDLVAEIHRRAVLRSLTDEAWLDHRLRAYFGITAP